MSSNKVLFRKEKNITNENQIKIRKNQWYNFKISIIGNNLAAFIQSDDINWTNIFYDELPGLNKFKGTILIGTNSLSAHFYNIKMKKIFIKNEYQTKLLDLMKKKDDTTSNKSESNSNDGNIKSKG